MFFFRLNIQYTSMQQEKDAIDTNFMYNLNKFEAKNKAFINLIIKPVFTLIIFLSVGYYTLWMSTNYVQQDKFSSYIEQQIISDARQDENARNRFELTQTKLETIINQQIIFNEQLKTYNTMMTSYQKQVDSLNERLLFVERK
jgi:hypothetical protein